MASRHDIIQIDFRANAGRANKAVESIRMSAKDSRDAIVAMQKALNEGIAAGNGQDWIDRQTKKIRDAKKELKAFEKAERELVKGVDVLSRGIDAFNNGSLDKMSAAMQKAIGNAARLARSKMTPDTAQSKKDIAEMDALIMATDKNLVKSRQDFAELVNAIKTGGKTSTAELSLAKEQLKELMNLTARGTKEWKGYEAQLKVIESKFQSLALEEQRMAGKDALKQVFSGNYTTKTRGELEKMIQTLRQYQSAIADPEGKGARHFMATETALQKLSAQLGKTKGNIMEVQQALKVAGAAGTANRFGGGLEQQGKKMAQAFRKTIDALNKMKEQQENLRFDQQHGIPLTTREQAMLAKLDAQIPNTTARIDRLRNEMIQLHEANNLTTKGISQSIAVLRQQQETVAVGSPAWLKYEAAISSLENRLKIMRGEAMSLFDAMRLSTKAGGQGFTGTAKQLQLAEQAIQKAAAGAQKGSAEWQKYQQALAKVRVEMQNAGMTSERMQAIIAKPTNAKNLNELQAAVKRAKAELDLMAGTVGKNNKAYQDLARRTKEAEIQMKQLQSQSHGTASAFEKAWSRLKTYIGLYMGAAVAIQKIISTLGDLLELSDKMGEVRKTTGFTAEEVGRLSENLKKMDTRTPLTGLMELSASAGQLGLKTEEDVLGFTEAANKLMVALPEMGREAATQMLKVALATGEIDRISKQIQEGTIEGSSAVAVAMEKVGSTIDRLRASSASAAPAITDFVQRVGAVGAQSGISIDQVAALGSTVDALGMRVEMSATALSRMIPAIKNNAFDVAHAIGVTPDTLRNLFDTGRGMEAILMIFQHIKDAGMNEDSIEQMLGLGGMKEIMKELNQQGARAGIVFAGLSQNVDELRRQLGVAATAYEENIAIQQEYDKMNETTAAKWERLKNQLEEAFVGDSARRLLGGLIDALRMLVDFLTGNVGPALNFVSGLVKTFIVYWGILKLGMGEAVFIKAVEGLKSMASGFVHLISNTQRYIKYSALLKRAHTEQTRAAIKARMAQEGLNKAMLANVWMAVVVAVGFLIYKLIDFAKAAKESGREAARFNAQLQKEQEQVNELTDSIGKARIKIEEAEAAVKKARAALEAAKAATDGTTESTKRLTKAESDLMATEERKKNAMAEHKRLIEQFNTQYSKYLGFMLSEVASNFELANARDLVNSKLRETITLKRQEAALERIEKNRGEDRDKKYGDLYDFLGRFTGRDITFRPRVMGAITKAANSAKDSKDFEAQINKIFNDNNLDRLGPVSRYAWSYFDEVYGIRQANERVKEQFAGEMYLNRQMSQTELIKMVNSSFANYNALLKKYKGSKGDERARNAAAVLQQMDTLNEMQQNSGSYYDLSNPEEARLYKKQLGQLSKWKGFDRNALLKEAGKYYKPRTTMGDKAPGDSFFTPSKTFTGGYTGTNEWGNEVDATSTDYGTWDVNELVARRNQMNKFKNVLKPGIDVRAVLAEDKALMKAIDEGKVGADWQSVLDWYNTERKKIQQELKSERFSTNEGNWRDEATKKGRKRRNPLVESDYALAELDRYYSRRKEALEKARSEENISEELYNRQVEILEQEHLERRSKLRGTFTGEVSKAETAAFREWWHNLEKMDELDHVPWEVVESEWSKAIAAQIGRNNLRMQQDLTQVEAITMKHINQIAKIIAKERPYDGITQNLQANLTKLDILFADLGTITKKQLEDGSLTKDLSRRLSFLLDEAEHAYSLTTEQIDKDMREKGFGAWADALANDENGEELKRQLLAQLQTAYDAVQEAIKKEASLIKKQAEIQWNDAAMSNGQSRKQAYESALSALGLQEDQVKRANSLIGAGNASQRVADKLAIKQMQIRLAMQEQYYNLIRKTGLERIAQLESQGKMEDAEHVRKSLNLALSEEQKKTDEQRVAIQNQLEESQNRLYTELKSWSDLLAKSVQSVFEASHAGDAEYYNERAKMSLTGKGGPGAGTYIVIDNSGTSNATAHYEHLNEREALERQHEIERENAQAEAWRKVMDDINMKMSESITDMINATLQNASVDANTQAVLANTQALYETAGMKKDNNGIPDALALPETMGDSLEGTPPWQQPQGEGQSSWFPPLAQTSDTESFSAPWAEYAETSTKATNTVIDNNKKAEKSTKASFAAMTAAANMYGIAYQAMSNENLSTAQKVEMMIVQAAGQAMISMLTASLAADTAETASHAPSWISKTLKELGPIGGPVAVGVFTALIGGLLGAAAGKITKSKSQIAQVTGASSASAGRLATGMLTYAEGNVNEFTDPASLTVGRSYNVDGADGKTYRARYMGKNPRTHITTGPEFHLVGEAGQEAIIDAKTTRQIRMDDNGIWKSIQMLYNGRHTRLSRVRRGRGVTTFADGNLDDFEDVTDVDITASGGSGMNPEILTALQTSIDRQSDLLDRALTEGIKGVFSVYGKDGLIDSYDTGKKTVTRHGEKY